MPEGAVYVGRPSKFGNPLPLPFEQAMYRRWLTLGSDRANRILADIGELRGKDLACWCRPGAPCHADVLLELANLPLFPNGESNA